VDSNKIFILDQDENLLTVLSNESEEACPFYDAPYLDQENAVVSLEFSVPASHPDSVHVKEDNHALIKVKGEFKLFTIKLIEDEHGGELTKRATCDSAALELRGDIIEDLTVEDSSPNVILEKMLEPTRWQLGKVDYFDTGSIRFYYVDVIEAINQLIKKFDAVVDFRIEFSGNKIVGRYVDIKRKSNEFSGKVFEYSKDITKVTREVDATEIKTAVIPRGKSEDSQDDYAKRTTISEVDWSEEAGDLVDKPIGQTYIGDKEALANYGRLNEDGTRRHNFYIFEDGQTEDPEELARLAWEDLQSKVNPRVTYEAEVIDLAELLGLDHEGIERGMLVLIKDKDLGIRVAARIIEMTRYIGQPEKAKVVLGNYVPLFVDDALRIDSLASTLDENRGVWDSKLGSGDSIPTEMLEGNIPTSILEGAIDTLNNEVRSENGFVYITDTNGIEVLNRPKEQDPTKSIRIKGGVIAIANSKNPDGSFNYRSFGDGDGFTADLITAGRLKAAFLQIGDKTEYAEGYDPSTKETPEGAQSKADQAAQKAEESVKYYVDVTDFEDGHKVYNNRASFKSNDLNAQGAIVVHTPLSLDDFTVRAVLTGYSLEDNSDVDLVIGFYAGADGFDRYSFVSRGSREVSRARLATDNNGKVVIILENDNSIWTFPSLTLEQVQVGKDGDLVGLESGWSIALDSSLSYSNVIEVPSRVLETAEGAQAKATQALNDARNFAESRAAKAQEAAEEVAKAQDDLLRTSVMAYADDKVTDEEQARILEASNNLTEAKKHAEEQAQAAESAAREYAESQAGAAKAAAKEVAEAEAALAEERAIAHADGIVDTEEKARLEEARQNLADAKTHAESQAALAQQAANDYTLGYSEKKRTESTTAPTDTDALWIDTSQSPNVIKRYDSTGAVWKKLSPTEAIEIGAETPEGAQAKADKAEEQAKAHAETKAADAQEAAESYALAQAKAERTQAEAYADGVVSDEEQARIDDANAKLAEAKDHAESEAQAALTASKSYADAAASDAEQAASEYALAQAKAERVKAESYADGVVSAEEQARIDDANAKLTAAKTHAETQAAEAEAAAKSYAETQSSNAEAAAKEYAEAQASAERIKAEAYADGVVSNEEQARIDDANAKLAEAKRHAESEASAAKDAAQTYAATKANEAREAAEAVAKTEAELAETRAKAYADGVLTDEERADLAGLEQELEDAKEYARTQAASAESAAKSYADTTAQDAQAAAESYALAQAKAQRTEAEAYADGRITKEEQARIDDANAKLSEAKRHADNAASTAEGAAKSYASSKASTAESNAKNYASSKAGTAESNAKSYANSRASQAESNAKSYAAKGQLYARGTGNNRSANRILKLNDETIYNTAGRGLRLTVISRSDLSVQFDHTYDVYGGTSNNDALADKLNNLKDNVIVVLTSYDAMQLTTGVRDAMARVGGTGTYFGGSFHRVPYALVGIPNIGKGAGIEVFTDVSDDAPRAEITTKIVDGTPQGIDTTRLRLAETAESNAKNHADSKASTAESNAKSYASSKASTAESNAKSHADSKAATAEKNAKAYRDLWAYPNSVDIDGGHIRANTVTANQIKVGSLSALTANLGTVTAGTIKGVRIEGSTISQQGGNGEIELSKNGLTTYDADGKKRIVISTSNESFQSFSPSIISFDPWDDHSNLVVASNASGLGDGFFGYIENADSSLAERILTFRNWGGRMVLDASRIQAYGFEYLEFKPNQYKDDNESHGLNMQNGEIYNLNNIRIGDPGFSEGIMIEGGTGWRIAETNTKHENSSGGLHFIRGGHTSQLELSTNGSLYMRGADRLQFVGRDGEFQADKHVTLASMQGSWLKVGDSNRVWSEAIYSRTYSGSSNMYVTGYGTIGRSTSASKYKLDITEVETDNFAERILELKPKKWFDKVQTEGYAEYLTAKEKYDNEEITEEELNDFIDEEMPYIDRHYGLIAEDLIEVGLEQYVQYVTQKDGSKEVEGLEYDRLWTLLIPIVKELREKVASLENELTKTKGEII
jgi:phage minor structural protein